MYDHCDGLWSDEPGRAMLLLTADCLPIAVARADGPGPAVGILHAGWRGLLDGIVAAGVRALGRGRIAAAIGPSIGPCCYEVGEDVATPFREAFGEKQVERFRGRVRGDIRNGLKRSGRSQDQNIATAATISGKYSRVRWTTAWQFTCTMSSNRCLLIEWNSPYWP